MRHLDRQRGPQFSSPHSVHATVLWGVILLAILLLVAGAAAAAPVSGKLADAQANYQRERAICLSGQSNQDKATCLKEAGAALQDAKNGRLYEVDRSDYQRNALQRCQQQVSADDKAACERRILGEGEKSGSVAAGGILREYKEVIPVPAGTPVQ
ncbi:hypothetical protein [Undibacterium terreum]|uniref:Uncharacterized protein n=1 Tax=Undibacterium terreum TaxID=1224302 RepID=A0A916XBG6_9BURK|nr:hypothetical protein [Undibacterium terreum]GGC61167.1 hypothetical protein GCM10011396_05210 [Undibacterium terreum]